MNSIYYIKTYLELNENISSRALYFLIWIQSHNFQLYNFFQVLCMYKKISVQSKAFFDSSHSKNCENIIKRKIFNPEPRLLKKKFPRFFPISSQVSKYSKFNPNSNSKQLRIHLKHRISISVSFEKFLLVNISL